MEAIKGYNNWFFLNQMILKLQNEVNYAASDVVKEEIWLSLSEKVISYCNKNFIGKDTSFSDPALHIVRYLRCSLFWMTQNWKMFEREIEIAIKEQYSPVFLIIRGFYSLQFLVDISSNPNTFQMLRTSSFFIKEAEAYFNMALADPMLKNQKYLRSAILWGKSWILCQLKQEKAMSSYVNKAWVVDGKNLGEGWQFWAKWLGRSINPLDNLILLDSIEIKK